MSRWSWARTIGCGVLLGCSKSKPEATAAPESARDSAAAAPAPEEAGDADGLATPVAPVDETPALTGVQTKAVEAASLAELSTELGGYEQRLRARGVKLRGYAKGAKREEHERRKPVKQGSVPTGSSTTSKPATAPNEPRDRCSDICELATAVCGLRDRICDLASAHEDEDEYADACARAERDCWRASEACDACS